MGEGYPDKLLRRMQQISAAGGVDLEVAVDTVYAMQRVLKNRIDALDGDSGDICEKCGRGRVWKAGEVKMMVGALNECARMIEFCKGLPESRREVMERSDNVLAQLTDEQLEVVRGRWGGAG